jgi:site-specific DNA-adenine methylase
MSRGLNFVSYYGGKNKQSNWIYSFITPEMKNNTKIFTEVFAGAFWVYLNEDFSFANKIVYNDMNQYLTNFYACVATPVYADYLENLGKPGNLLHFDVNLKPTAKETYDHYYAYFKKLFQQYRQELYYDKIGQEVQINIPDFDLAVKYGIMLRHAFSGISNDKQCGYSYSASSYHEGKKCPEPKSQMLIRKVRDKNLVSKLNKVSAFETLDFEKHIEKYDSKETLFYADPPYFSTEFQYYRGAEHFGREGHQRLADVLSCINGKFILSYYDFDGLDKMYPKDKFRWEEKSFTKASTTISNQTLEEKQGHEILIMNY